MILVEERDIGHHTIFWGRLFTHYQRISRATGNSDLDITAHACCGVKELINPLTTVHTSARLRRTNTSTSTMNRTISIIQ